MRIFVSLIALSACRAMEEPPDPTVGTGDTAPLWGEEPLRVEVDPAFPHHVRAILDVRGEETARLVCTSEEEAEERHVWEGPAETQTQVDVSGLLADTPYRCELTVDGTVVAAASARTPAPTWTLPDWELSVHQPDPERGYTLFNTWSVGNPTDQKLLVIDPEGRPRLVLPITEPDNGGVEFTWLPQSQRFLAAGGYGYPPTLLTPWGAIASQVGLPESGFKWHHDVEEVADGVVAALSQTVDTAPDGALYQGFAIEERRIDTGEPVWVWNSQSAVDAGTLDPGQGGPDRYHANALSFVEDDPDGPAYWVALAYDNRIVRIDRSTGALTWQLGFRGDFELVDATGAALPDAEWFFHGHDPEIRLPLLLVHDNGVGRPGVPDSSRVVEYEVDLASKTVTRLWSWTEPGWYENVLGDADRLENGHVLVAQGHCFICPTGDPDRRSALVELVPETGEVVWRLDFPARETGVYRADRFDGCALFANQRYCPELR